MSQIPVSADVQCLSPAGLHRMRYVSWGPQDAPDVLLCVHGLTRQGRDFDTLAQHMVASAAAAGRPLRVVCPDVVGRGLSDWLPAALQGAAYQVPQYAADMITLIARLRGEGLQRLHWVGTSMGGLIGMGVAGLPDSPVASLLLNDVGPVLEVAALRRIGTYVGTPVQWPTFEAASDGLWAVSAGFGPHTREQQLTLSRPQLRQTHDAPDAPWVSRYDPAIAAAFRNMGDEQVAAGEAALWRSYDAIRCPTLVLRGAESDLLSAETLQAMTQRGPRAQTATVDGVGHAPTLVQPEQMAVVERFVLGQMGIEQG
ncbi:alpha/beta fold hydrolase [Amphibiibacter pelophylacis]|uniref:Alpha/beta hydrolase n=1 Tax=Amphibiibacter pelophylacis TaxID=1799477 RepID=A0ACC6P4N1_9BURK